MVVAIGRKLIVFFIVVGLAIVGAFGWVGYQLFMTGFSARTEPHALEVLMARQIRHLTIPIEKRNAQNPIPLTPEVMKESLAHFVDHCALCHANDGSGQTPIGKNVNPKALDLRLPEIQSMSDGEIFWDAGELDQMKALNPKAKKDLEEEAAFDQFLQGDGTEAARTRTGHHH